MQDNTPSVQIFIYQGVDRVSSELMLEGTQERLQFFPVTSTPLIMAMNFIDDNILGGMSKRPGFNLFLDNPDNQPVQALVQYTTGTGITQMLRISGNHIYMWPMTGIPKWGSPVYTLVANNQPINIKEFGGYLFFANGTDPLLMWDGVRMYKIQNSVVNATLSAPIGTGDTSVPVNPISFTTDGNDFPPVGFLQNGSEIIQYLGYTLNGSNQITAFTSCIRGYADTTAASALMGAVFPVWYGSPPLTPRFVAVYQTRLFAANTSDGPNKIMWTAALNEPTTPFNWIIDNVSTAANIAFSGFTQGSLSYDPGQISGVDDSGQNMLWYKPTKTYLMTVDQNNLPVQFLQIDGSMGTLSQKSITNIQNTQLSFGYNGVQVYNGQGLMLLSKPIDDLVKGVPIANLNQIASNAYDFKFFISVGNTTEADRFGAQSYSNITFVYNYLTTYWFIWQTPFTINCMKNMVDTNSNLQMFVGDTNGNTFVFNPNKNQPIYTDGGDPIACYLKTKYLYFNKPSYRKAFKNITCITEQGKNATIAFSGIKEDLRSDYTFQQNLPGYITRFNCQDFSAYYYAMSYLINESSTAPFFFYGIEQEIEYMRGY